MCKFTSCSKCGAKYCNGCALSISTDTPLPSGYSSQCPESVINCFFVNLYYNCELRSLSNVFVDISYCYFNQSNMDLQSNYVSAKIAENIAEELSIPIGTGITIAAKAWGPNNSKFKVLGLHGWLDNANTFDVIGPVMASSGIRMICVDFIGHGRSPHKPTWCNLYYTDYITQVVDVADALGWKTFSIVGHSMGAGIGSIVAATVPHMVEKIVCLDFIGLMSREQDQLQAIQIAMASRDSLIKRKPFLYPSRESIVEKLKSNNPFISDDAARRLLARSIETVISPSGDQMYKLRHDPRLVGPSIFTMREHEVLVMLKSISCPVMLIWGTVSAQQFGMKKNWPEVMEKRMECIKNLETLQCQGSHHFHLENISSFIDRLINFVKENQEINFSPPPNTFVSQENHNQLAEAGLPKSNI
ncbi:alpha/beta hydrolase fold-1 domain-containing protein [Heterostelium album PN500]|uniref:Alpha/beta hydrolase fold-1 domain-containing protein n=1 Tax=Heterostelium pallidum (strain ATCC 26659 / Pp 5 / PN500) TaxID=670386 RepID=D3BES9_HETP5|nr:alpha/beta hydrolase fold-1 domain-containing protein [Heterostelium album PN500]EFA80410.1 alpha/beta hydrolase fold-1 domain-containing protein [Heterostelium album PN500]|eukprot:XP_020432530.1 alpha/beta hydrolase fold-1 domain-containing protein [Heterostelium album PN500]